jgi:hypothetical protein
VSRLTITAALLAAGLVAPATAEDLALPRDGWAGWSVPAVESTPDQCCWSGWDGSATRTACKLDEHRGNSGNRDRTATDVVRVYARLAGGKVEHLRVLSATCAVEATAPIHDLGAVPPDVSARWLARQISPGAGAGATRGHHFVDQALAALGMHQGEVAFDALVAVARSRGEREERKKAVFWLAHLRGTAGADVTTDLMFNDPDADLRRHATFALTQSKSPRIAQDLIRLGNTDQDGDVRAQAWFWLAQTRAADAEQAIGAALRTDSDERVREQAVFALSRLGDERATSALIAAAEDRSLPREQRKRALFWLAQSEAKEALAYLDKVLAADGGD